MEFIRSNLIKDRASAAETIEKDLPTGPLSHLILTLSCCQATDEITIAEMLAFINDIEITKKGVGIMSLQSEDLYGLNCFLYRKNPVKTNNAD